MASSRASARRVVLLVVIALGLLLPAGAGLGAPRPHTIAYGITFTGTGRLVSTSGDASTGTTVFTTSFTWALSYRVGIRVPAHRAVGVPSRPGKGSSVTGSSVGVVHAGGPSIEAGCGTIAITLDRTERGITGAGRSRSRARLSFVVPAFGGLVRFGACDSPLKQSSVCASPKVVAVTVALNPSYAWQRWTASRTCEGGGETGHWRGVIHAVRLSR
jgi:hypothetical protein